MKENRMRSLFAHVSHTHAGCKAFDNYKKYVPYIAQQFADDVYEVYSDKYWSSLRIVKIVKHIRMVNVNMLLKRRWLSSMTWRASDSHLHADFRAEII